MTPEQIADETTRHVDAPVADAQGPAFDAELADRGEHGSQWPLRADDGRE